MPPIRSRSPFLFATMASLALLAGAAIAAKVVIVETTDIPEVNADGSLNCADPPETDIKAVLNTKNNKIRLTASGQVENASGETQVYKDNPEVEACLDTSAVIYDRQKYKVSKSGKAKFTGKGILEI